MEYRGRKIWLIYFAARFINGKVMKICSLLASGGKIWNLFKAAVVTSSRQVYQRMKVSQLVAYISRMRPHYRKYIFVDRPPNNIFWTFFSFDPCSNSCSNIFQIVLRSSSSSSSSTTTQRFKRNPPVRASTTTIQLDFTSQHFSNFEATSFRNNIQRKEILFFDLLEMDSIRGLARNCFYRSIGHGWIARALIYGCVSEITHETRQCAFHDATNVFCPVHRQFPLIFNFFFPFFLKL